MTPLSVFFPLQIVCSLIHIKQSSVVLKQLQQCTLYFYSICYLYYTRQLKETVSQEYFLILFMSPLGYTQYLGKGLIIYTAYLQMQFYPGCCKDYSMLWIDPVFISIFMSDPPTPRVSERMNQNFNEVRKCIAIAGEF